MDNEKIYKMLEAILNNQQEMLQMIRSCEGISHELEEIKQSQIRLEQKMDLAMGVYKEILNSYL